MKEYTVSLEGFVHRVAPEANAAAQPMAGGSNADEAVGETGDEAGVMATYKGKQINLAEDWQDAQHCVEYAADDVRCYKDAAEYTADFAKVKGLSAQQLAQQLGDAGRCPARYLCLWDGISYTGRRLDFSSRGKKMLAKWGFRDKTSSSKMFQLPWIVVWDYRTLQPDPWFYHKEGGLPDYRSIKYSRGGNWNNKADQVDI